MALYSFSSMSFKGKTLLGTLAALSIVIVPAFAQESSGLRELGAGIAFGLAGIGAGIGLGYVGAAGLAALSENPAMQSRVFIFLGMVESIAIYGIVIVLIILG